MNEEELLRHAAFTVPITDPYLEKLRTLLKQEELQDCLPCLEYMVKHRVKLEQEALLSAGRASPGAVPQAAGDWQGNLPIDSGSPRRA
jgi:hypothetical protein